MSTSTGAVPTFHPHFDIFGLVVLLVVGYEFGLKATSAPQREEAVTRRQRLFFYGGVGLVLIVSSWPFHDIGEQSLFLFHMAEHLVLAFVAAPLLLMGIPRWLLRAVLRPVLPGVKLLTRPIVALFLFNATLGLIHVPAIVELMVESSTAHFIAHSVLFGTALLMWFPVLGPIPDVVHLPPFLRIGYLFLQSLVPTIPASFLTLGDQPLYKVYETFPRLGGLSAHTDQILAGLLMKFGGGLLLWSVMAAIFFRWHADDQRPERTSTVASLRQWW